MANKLILPIISTLLIFSFFSCDSKDDKDLIPSYIHIERINLSDNSEINEGSLSHNITDAWLYVDGEYIGTFELPATIPVLKEGNVNVKIKPGIKLNGISTTRVPYPHYNDWIEDNVLLTRKEITTVHPEVQYKTNLSFPWKEDFELTDISIVENNADTVMMTASSNEAFEGNGHGRVVLEGERILYEGTSDTTYVLPRNLNSYIFLELNFKTNVPITVGIYAINPATQVPRGIVTLNKTEEWKKIYINLTNSVMNTDFAQKYKIFFHTNRTTNEDPILFEVDNIKLIYNS